MRSIKTALHRAILVMADSEYESDSENGSDEEYVGSRASSVPQSEAVGKRKAQPKVQPKATERKAHAWARRGSTPPEEDNEYVPAEDGEGEDDLVPQRTLQHIEEERKRKRYVEALLGMCAATQTMLTESWRQITKRHETFPAGHHTPRSSRTRSIGGDE